MSPVRLGGSDDKIIVQIAEDHAVHGRAGVGKVLNSPDQEPMFGVTFDSDEVEYIGDPMSGLRDSTNPAPYVIDFTDN